MDVEMSGNFGIDFLQKAQKLLVAIPLVEGGDDPSGSHVQGGKERVAGVLLGPTGAQGQNGLSPVQGLDLALLIEAVKDGARFLWGIEVKADDVAHLFHEANAESCCCTWAIDRSALAESRNVPKHAGG
jgi:hypothetical protein